MKSKKATALAFTLLLGAGLVLYLNVKRPQEHVSLVVLPGEKSISVHGTTYVRQQLTAPTDSITGISFQLDEASLRTIPPTTPLFLHVRTLPTRQELRTVESTFAELYQTEHITYYGETATIDQPVAVLKIPFELITNARNKQFEFTVEAPTLTKQTNLLFSYQHDATKFTGGELFVVNNKKPGTLGLFLYERPTITTLIWRWLIHPDHRAAWLGLGLILVSVIALQRARLTPRKIFKKSPWPLPAPAARWQKRWATITLLEVMVAGGLCVLATLVVYWSATQFSFFQDDIPILLRAMRMTSSAELIFTNHPLLLPHEAPVYPIGFYRPITYSLIPWLLYHLFGLSAGMHHVVHLLLLGVATTSIYLLARLYLGRLPAALTSALWLTHSSKVAIAYWLSSVQDVIAVLLFVAAVVVYTHRRSWSHPARLWPVWVLYLLAMYSKDYAILLPLIIVLIELAEYVQHKTPPWKNWFFQQLYLQLPFIGLAGFYLLTRTIALGDPSLPHFTGQDTSYHFTVSPAVVTENLLTYAIWTAELGTPDVVGPVYPGAYLIVVAAVIIWWYRRQKPLRTGILLGLLWWGILLLPNLLLAHEPSSRWLTLSTFGTSLSVSLILWHVLRRNERLRAAITLTLLGALLISSAIVFRQPQHTGIYQTATKDAEAIVTQYKQYQQEHGPPLRLVFRDIAPELRGTLNRRLLHLYFSDVPEGAHYCSSPCSDARTGDVVLTTAAQQ